MDSSELRSSFQYRCSRPTDPISYRTATLYQPCGPRCTRLSHWKVGRQPMKIRPFQFDQELGESAGLLPGLYKPAVPDPQHDTWTSSSRARSSEERPPSPTRTSRACSSGSRPRTGIVYPLQPRQSRPDVCITVEASLPEPAALHRQEPWPTREAPTSPSRSHRRLGRKRRRNRSSVIYRPAKRSPPRGRWCDI